MNELEHEFLVLGDLGGGRYIVRMFVGDQTYDEMIDSPLAELQERVDARMHELANQPDEQLLAEAERPATHPGHAVELPA